DQPHDLPAGDAVEAVADVGPGDPARAGVAGLGERGDCVPDTQASAVGETPGQQRRVDLAVEGGQQGAFDDPVGQRWDREPAGSAAGLGDLYLVGGLWSPLPLGQGDREVADPAGGVGFELLQLSVGSTVGEAGVADVLPGVEQRL